MYIGDNVWQILYTIVRNLLLPIYHASPALFIMLKYIFQSPVTYGRKIIAYFAYFIPAWSRR